jgi:hypothetical protein
MLLKLMFAAFRLLLVSMSSNVPRKVTEVPKFKSEFSKMSTAEFAQAAMQRGIAPRDMGSVKERLAHAQRLLARRGWTPNRVRDVWYADARCSAPKWEEINDLEELSGLKYARQELRTNDQIIANADALLMGSDPNFYSAFVAALRAFHRASRGPGTEGTEE